MKIIIVNKREPIPQISMNLRVEKRSVDPLKSG
jgi:hypothetical protein